MASTVDILGSMKGGVMGHPETSRRVDSTAPHCLHGWSCPDSEPPGLGSERPGEAGRRNGNLVSQAAGPVLGTQHQAAGVGGSCPGTF